MARASARSAAALTSPLVKGRAARHVLYLIGGRRSFGSFRGIVHASLCSVNSRRSFDDLVGAGEQRRGTAKTVQFWGYRDGATPSITLLIFLCLSWKFREQAQLQR